MRLVTPDIPKVGVVTVAEYTKPRAVNVAPPLLVTLPLRVAELPVMLVAALVVTAALAAVVKVTGAV